MELKFQAMLLRLRNFGFFLDRMGRVKGQGSGRIITWVSFLHNKCSGSEFGINYIA